MKNNYKKYDIVMVDFGENAMGSEQKHIRPALIVQNDKGNLFSPCTIVIPLSHVKKGLHIPTHTLIKKDKVNGLKMDSILIGEQIRVISEQRIIGKLGRIENQEILDEIQRVLFANFD